MEEVEKGLRDCGFQVERRPSGEIKMVRSFLSNTSDKELRVAVSLAKRFEHIEKFSICHTRVTNKGLVYLEDLTNASSILVIGTDATVKGIRRLVRNMPECIVEV